MRSIVSGQRRWKGCKTLPTHGCGRSELRRLDRGRMLCHDATTSRDTPEISNETSVCVCAARQCGSGTSSLQQGRVSREGSSRRCQSNQRGRRGQCQGGCSKEAGGGSGCR